MKKIGIVMGSDSDLPVVEKAMATLEKFGVPFEAHVYSAQNACRGKRICKGRKGKWLWCHHCGSGKGGTSGRCHGGKYNPSRNWYSYQILHIGWIGCSAFHRTDAGGTSCCNRSH